MEIKVGEYIRTKNGVIAKLIDISLEEDEYCYIFDNTIYRGYTDCIEILWEKQLEEYIVNYSEDIIDLIEEGDYVNGFKVRRVHEVPNEKIGKVVELDDNNVCGYEYEPEEIYKEDIKTVVTKEQFAEMEYKVGE